MSAGEAPSSDAPDRNPTSGVPAELMNAALAAQARAHCPYSSYPVGVAIRAGSGAIYSGCNVENASSPEGTCAETGAIAAMVLGGDHEIAEVVVVTNGATPGTPCGGCRQRIREFAGPDTMIHSTTATSATSAAAGGEGVVLSMSLHELLPESFGPDHLG